MKAGLFSYILFSLFQFLIGIFGMRLEILWYVHPTVQLRLYHFLYTLKSFSIGLLSLRLVKFQLAFCHRA